MAPDDDFLAHQRRKRKQGAIAIIVVAGVLPALFLGFLSYRSGMWKRRSRPVETTTPSWGDPVPAEPFVTPPAEPEPPPPPRAKLSPKDRARFVAALDKASKKVDLDVAALQKVWPKMVDGTIPIVPRADLGACSVAVDGPRLRTDADDLIPLDGGTGEQTVYLEDSGHAATQWTYFDGRSAKKAHDLERVLPPDLRARKVEATGGALGISVHPIATAPIPRATQLLSKRIASLREDVDAEHRVDRHAAIVERAEALLDDATGDDLFAILDLWVDPIVRAEEGENAAKNKDFSPGVVFARSFIWESGTNRVVCAGRPIAESSGRLVFRRPRAQAFRDDLTLQLERALAFDLAVADRRRR